MMMLLGQGSTLVPQGGLVLEHGVKDLMLELLRQEELMLQGLMEEVSKAGDEAYLLAQVRVPLASWLGENEWPKCLEGDSLGGEEICEGRDDVDQTHGWSTRFSNQYYKIRNDQPNITLRLHYSSMTQSPFTRLQSPILELYTHSRSKSHSHSTLFRSRSHSYRQFQVKTIRNALEQNHIIERDANLPRERQIKRQRQMSKYYGAEVFKQNVHVPQAQKSPIITTQPKKQKISKIQTLLNIQQQTMKGLNSQRYMGYESNYNIYQKTSIHHVGESSNSLRRSLSSRSSQRKTSFFSQVGNSKDESESKKSRFQEERKIDRVREEYYEISPSQKVFKVKNFRKNA